MSVQIQASLTIVPQIANILVHEGDHGTRFWLIVISLVAGATVLVAICWGFVEEWIERTHGRNWPTVPAVIDAVSVTLVESKGISSAAIHCWPSYVAMLTYSYSNPERHTGGYSRSFGNEDEAQTWADSYKGETVKVHVDPRDPTRSVLRKEDL